MATIVERTLPCGCLQTVGEVPTNTGWIAPDYANECQAAIAKARETT